MIVTNSYATCKLCGNKWFATDHRYSQTRCVKCNSGSFKVTYEHSLANYKPSVALDYRDISGLNRVTKMNYGMSGFRSASEANRELKRYGFGIASREEAMEAVRKDVEDKQEIKLSQALEKKIVDAGKKLYEMNRGENA